MFTRSVPALLAALAIASTALAQTPPPTAQPAVAKPPACNTPEHRQFDFWVGEWDVTQSGGVAGTNRIEKVLGGCALLESWVGSKGSKGHSLNFYDAQRGMWHQTWIDNAGSPLALDGRFENGRMILIGKGVDPATKGPITHRITWTPLPEGKVRQLWEASRDGKGWTVLFDGIYSPRS